MATGRLIHGRGTDERDWQSWAGWQRIAPVDLDELVPPGSRLVVIAPHPDDEVLGTGGLLAAAADAGRPLVVVAVTDGGASHPGSSRWPVPVLVEQRAAERRDALQQLGADATRVLRLNLPDGSVHAHLGELTDRLAALLTADDVVVAPWQLDGHPDHEAVATAAAAAANGARATSLQVPIWGWHWVDPDCGGFGEQRAVRFDLTADVLARKRAAVRSFVSQLTADRSTGADPILPGWALDRLLRDREVFFR